MVYCTKCGIENPDDATECKSCGASLSSPPYGMYRRRREDDWCFGAQRSTPIWGIFIGLLIIVAGVISILEDVYWWASWDRLWPILVIAFGLFIIYNVLYKR